MIRVSGQSKSRSVKAAGAESCGQRRNQKLHAAVAKSTFSSENVQNMSAPKHFLKLKCRKIARRGGEKHMWQWKCTKHEVFGALLYVEMSKNDTPLWRKVHWEVKMHKTWRVWTTFVSSDVAKLYDPVAKPTFASENVKKLRVREHFLKFGCRKNARRCGETYILK